jgi:hypothetical protein
MSIRSLRCGVDDGLDAGINLRVDFAKSLFCAFLQDLLSLGGSIMKISLPDRHSGMYSSDDAAAQMSS